MKKTIYELTSEKIKKEYVIVHLSDIHDRPIFNCLNEIEEVKPDYIFITGDLVDTKLKESKNGIGILKRLVKISKVYYCLGNHEYVFEDDDIKLIKNLGVNFLDDEYVRVDDFLIGGLTSYGIRNKNIKEKTRHMKGNPNVSWIDDMEKEEGYKVILSHHPEYYPKYLKNKNVDLILSGHCHGGQIRFFKWGLFAPGQGLFAKYNHGLYDNKLLVSSGMANTGKIVPRFFNPREIVIIKVKKR